MIGAKRFPASAPLPRGGFGRLAALTVLYGVCAGVGPFFHAYVSAQTLPLDDKARYERSLETKVEEVLFRLLGPNQAKVVVEAGMDFTRTEKVDMTSQAAAGAAKDSMFKWDGSSTEHQIVADYLLPGFPNMGALGDGKPENTTYQKQMLFPASFIKKLAVTVILNKNLPDSEAQAVRNVVTEILSMDAKRGDELIIIKTPFAPFWRTIWYTPEAMGMVFKYGILTVMGIIAMVVVAIGFLKLAGAMNTMAKAQQSHQITMDMGKGLSGLPGLPGLPGGGGGPIELLSAEKKEKEAGGGGAGAEGEKVVFNVRPDQVVFLVNMMANEDPANVALVAAHLPPEVRGEFLRRLSPDAASEVIFHMAKVRFVEPEVVGTIKDELERRLSGALGGVQQVVEVLEKVNLRAKREMLEKLSEKDPETARAVRSRVFLPEDLGRLSEKDLSVVISSFKIESLASAIWEFPQELKDAIRRQMAEKTWQMVEQTMKYGAPSRESSEKAVEELVGTALSLMKEGRVANPLESEVVMLSGPAAGGPEPPKPERLAAV
ncbi:MAG: FliG C-terminal domain-containing protein [Elusimicrobiales bacterium]|jgi:flagellar motor switch protein FliG